MFTNPSTESKAGVTNGVVNAQTVIEKLGPHLCFDPNDVEKLLHEHLKMAIFDMQT